MISPNRLFIRDQHDGCHYWKSLLTLPEHFRSKFCFGERYVVLYRLLLVLRYSCSAMLLSLLSLWFRCLFVCILHLCFNLPLRFKALIEQSFFVILWKQLESKIARLLIRPPCNTKTIALVKNMIRYRKYVHD